MFKNYLKVILRNFKKHKGYSLINIAGLAVGMACCMFILAFILHELSYDRFHENSGRIVRLAMDATIAEQNFKVATIPAPMGPQLVEDFPEVVNSVRFRDAGSYILKYGDKQFDEQNILHVDNSFFDVFSLKLIKGDPKTALEAPYSMVITPETAERYFGDEDPMGRMLHHVEIGEEFRVTGIVQSPPLNSHFSYDMLVSFETLVDSGRYSLGWNNFNYQTYLLLDENAAPGALEAKMGAFTDKYLGEFLRAMGGKLTYIVQPLTSIHLGSKLERELQPNGDIRYVYAFAVIGIFILLIACINFMNLSTARSADRAKEVGLRKVLGAEKKRLVGQFLGESFFMALLSMILATILVSLFKPYFQELIGQKINVAFISDPLMAGGLLILFLFVGFAAGSYPALYLSGFTPASIMKASVRHGTGSNRLRRVLVVFQFAISIVLIISTGIISGQIDYMRSKKLGFDKEQVLVLLIRDNDLAARAQILREELVSLPGVRSGSTSQRIPGDTNLSASVFMPEGWEEGQTALVMNFNADDGYLETYNIELAAGRNFSPEFTTDFEQTVLVNETAVREFGWEDDPVGKRIYYGGDDEVDFDEGGFYTVVGVMKDFHNRSLHHKVEPVMIQYSHNNARRLALKIETEDVSTLLKDIEAKWKSFAGGGLPFDYYFLDEYFDGLYRSEERLGGIFRVFTIFAVFIGCLGLFGLVSFAAERRTREIGIRKVLGSSAGEIVTLLCREFVLLVLLANIIAWPVAWLMMRRWLQSFPYQSGISPLIFLSAGLSAVVIALLTVIYRALKAANANPIEALKYE